jgi:hypothetical protein
MVDADVLAISRSPAVLPQRVRHRSAATLSMITPTVTETRRALELVDRDTFLDGAADPTMLLGARSALRQDRPRRGVELRTPARTRRAAPAPAHRRP